jgi:DNA-binding NtrC family response regulator
MPLVIADWRLPDGNGIDLADRAVKLRAKTIIISGYLFSLPAGAADRHGFLTKPISIFNLVAAVQHRIGNPSSSPGNNANPAQSDDRAEDTTGSI